MGVVTKFVVWKNESQCYGNVKTDYQCFEKRIFGNIMKMWFLSTINFNLFLTLRINTHTSLKIFSLNNFFSNWFTISDVVSPIANSLSFIICEAAKMRVVKQDSLVTLFTHAKRVKSKAKVKQILCEFDRVETVFTESNCRVPMNMALWQSIIWIWIVWMLVLLTSINYSQHIALPTPWRYSQCQEKQLR